MVTLKAVVEALLFASQKPLALNEIVSALRSAAGCFEDRPEAALANASEPEIADSLRLLQNEYSELSRSFQLVEQVSGWVLVSRTEYQIWVRQLFRRCDQPGSAPLPSKPWPSLPIANRSRKPMLRRFAV